jgi:hypothetical protein
VLHLPLLPAAVNLLSIAGCSNAASNYLPAGLDGSCEVQVSGRGREIANALAQLLSVECARMAPDGNVEDCAGRMCGFA